jgi:hypothetical protein
MLTAVMRIYYVALVSSKCANRGKFDSRIRTPIM